MGMTESREKVLEKYGPYVKSLAAQVRKQFNMSVDMEELVAWGQIGLLEAADRFDPKVGTNFLTFAHYRIKGAIFDGLRKMGVIKSPEARMAEKANHYMGNAASRDGGGGKVEDDIREIAGAVTGLAVMFAASMDSGDGGFQIADTAMSADDRLELEQTRKRVRAAVAKLPENQRKLLEGYYFEGKTLEEAGAEIGQSKSWASRLHARAVDSLKQLLEERDDDTYEAAPSRRTSDGGTTGGHHGSTSRAADGSGAKRPGPQTGTKQVR